MRFPPVVSRALIEKSGYLKSFPHLLGCVCALGGGDAAIGAAVDRFEAGGTWTDGLEASDLVLAPAACYPVYPLAARRGPIPRDGLIFDVASDCFRREPSRDLDRLQSFRMREFVFIGAPDAATAFRDDWKARAGDFADSLGLTSRIDPASDPFFGRGGAMVGRFQVEQALKFELMVPVRSAEIADRLHELQLPPRPFRPDLGPRRARTARPPTPPASPSAWTGWRRRCSPRTASIPPAGPRRSAPR